MYYSLILRRQILILDCLLENLKSLGMYNLTYFSSSTTNKVYYIYILCILLHLHRPFARRVPEFKFWYACTKATITALFMTFFEIFNIPVFWPILLLYFIVLFVVTMKRQIRHMIKHKYVPWSFGKVKYPGAGKATATTKNSK